MKYPVSDPGSQLYNGKFTDGDPSGGIVPSIDKSAHMNAVYDELTALIVGAGITPSETTLTQVFAAVSKLIGDGIVTRAPTNHGHLWNQISGIPATFPPAPHNQDWGTITGKPGVYPPADHNQDWSSITGKPGAYPPIAHDHPFVNSAGNADMLDGYHASDILNVFAYYLPNLSDGNSGQRGSIVPINTNYSAMSLPAGGVWFYMFSQYDGGGRVNAYTAGYAAGGTNMNPGSQQRFGFAIRMY